jgi:hypothetical protein
MMKQILLVVIATITGATPSPAQTRPRESLRGLHGVYLYVAPVAKEVEAGGLTAAQVKKVSEKALKDAGLEIYSEPQPPEGSANVAVTIDLVKYSDAAYLYSVNVSVLQEARLVRLPDEGTFPAQTWMAAAFGITGAHQMSLILEPLQAKLADFVNDFKTANRGEKK